jgi:hypothetical protein
MGFSCICRLILYLGLPPTLSQADISNYIKIGAENDGAIRQLGRFIVEVTSNDITGIQGILVFPGQLSGFHLFIVEPV